MKKKLALLCLVVLIPFLALPLNEVFAAYNYSSLITVYNNSSTTLGPIGVLAVVNNSQLASLGYISSGLDTDVTEASTDVPHAPGTTKLGLLFANGFGNHQERTVNYALGYTPAASSISIIPGVGGYLTKTDVAGWEPAGNYEIEYKGYVAGGSAVSSLTTGDDTSYAMTTVAWGAQTWTPATSGTAYGARVCLTSTGASDGSFAMSIRAASANKPTGADLVVSDTVTGFTWIAGTGTTAKYKTLNFTTPFNYTAGTTYSLVLKRTAASVNSVSWRFDTTSGAYAAGNYATSGDSGATWTAGTDEDFLFEILTAPSYDLIVKHLAGANYNDSVVLRSIGDGTLEAIINDYTIYLTGATTAGVKTIKLNNNTTNTKLWLDGAQLASGANTAVTNLASDWVMKGPYIEYYKHTVSGAQVGWYQPITLIDPTNIPDRSGNGNTGVLTYGTNPAAIEITYGNINPVTTYEAPSSGSTDPVNDVPVPGLSPVADPAETGVGFFMYDSFVKLGTALGVTTPVAYGLIFILGGIGVGFACLMGMQNIFGFAIGFGVTTGAFFSSGVGDPIMGWMCVGVSLVLVLMGRLM